MTTYHPRSVWEPDQYQMASSFDRTPARLNPARIDRAAIHYTAAINIPDGDPNEIVGGIDGIRRLLAGITIDYYTNRTGGGYRRLSDRRWFPGYPFGYSFAIDWLGGIWEGRGFDFQPAATSGHNDHTIAILMLTDRADPGTELMWASARELQRETIRRGARLANRPWAHGWFAERTGQGTRTACCGAALKAQIDAGLGDLDHPETSPPTIPQPVPETDMPSHLKRYPKVGVFNGDTLLLLTDDDIPAVTSGKVVGGPFNGVPVIDSDPNSDTQFAAVLERNGSAAAFLLGRRAERLGA